jgi:hypothetical protein
MTFYDLTLSSTPPWSDPPATPSKVVDHHGLNYMYDQEAASLVREREAVTAPTVIPLIRRVPIRARDRFRPRIEDVERRAAAPGPAH